MPSSTWRAGLAVLLAGVFGAVAAGGSSGATTGGAPTERNVILITLDDLRWDTPSFNGGPAKTPSMDRLAAMSVNFRSAMTTAGLCSPSRAALFTGRHGHQTGLDDNCMVWHSRLTGLDQRQSTLIEWARRSGYFVGYFGKWHLGADGPIQRGADRYPTEGIERGMVPGPGFRKPEGYASIRRFYDATKSFDQKPGYYGTRDGTIEGTGEASTTRQAVRFLDEAAQSRKRFLLCVNYHAPHPPYVVPKPFDTMYEPAQVVLPRNFLGSGGNKPRYQNDALWYWHDVGHLTEDDWRRMATHYWGFVTLVDRVLGDLLDAIQEHGLFQNTLVIMLGDQGSMIGEHGLYDKGPYCYEELMRIPLLIHEPGKEAGAVERQVSLIDVNQTIVEWLGLQPDAADRHSRSLLPLLKDPRQGWGDSPDEAFYRYEWYNGKWFGIRAIRTPRWKYCWNPVDVDELYDLQSDPEEESNRIDDPGLAGALEQMQRRLLEHLDETGDPSANRFRTEYNLD